MYCRVFTPAARKSLPRALRPQQPRVAAAVSGSGGRFLSSPPMPSPSTVEPLEKTPEEKRKDYITHEESKVRVASSGSNLCEGWGNAYTVYSVKTGFGRHGDTRRLLPMTETLSLSFLAVFR